MSDLYESTNKLPNDPYPERSGVLVEGIVDIPAASYVSNGTNYEASVSVDLTKFVRLGDRENGEPPRSFEAKVWKTSKVTPGGASILDYYRVLPITEFSYGPLAVFESARFMLLNSQEVGNPASRSLYLIITDQFSLAPTKTQSFSYKLLNTIFEYTDT